MEGRAAPRDERGAYAVKIGLSLVPALAAIVLLPLFIGLGYWQLTRAQEKRVLQAEYDRRTAQSPLRLDGPPWSAATLQFRRVSATGRYRPEYQVLLDNRVHRGVAGYHVVTPLALADSGHYVLVNRGWVPWGGDRQQLPPIDTPSTTVTVTGIAAVPHPPAFRLAEEDTTLTVWQHLDLDRYAKWIGAALPPVVVLLDPAADAGGLVREWNRLDAGIAVHQGYAFQWFALAAATVVLFGMLLRRTVKANAKGGST